MDNLIYAPEVITGITFSITRFAELVIVIFVTGMVIGYMIGKR